MSTISTNITEAFITPVLTAFPSGVVPSYKTLSLMQTELNQNARAIDSAADGHGHLVLTMSPTVYAALTNNVPFVIPVNPGDTPDLTNANTGILITEANRVLLVHQRVYNTYKKTDLALKAQIIAVCPEKYIRRLKVPNLGYSGCSTLELLTHLWTHYGKIDLQDLQANDKLMKTPWHPADPIEDLFSQLQTSYEFALADNANYPEIEVVRIGFQIIENTGFFEHDLRTWDDKPNVEWTLDNFYIHFETASRKHTKKTTKEAGFHSANSIAETIVSPVTNLAAAAPFSNLVAANLEIAKLQKLLKTKATIGNEGPTATKPPTTYCWTHGTSKNVRHTSLTCKAKADGHKDEATEANKMGGSTKVWTAPIPRE